MNINFNGVESVTFNVSEHPSMDAAVSRNSDVTEPTAQDAAETADSNPVDVPVVERKDAVQGMQGSPRCDEWNARNRSRVQLAVLIISTIGVLALGFVMTIFHTPVETIWEISAMVTAVFGIYGSVK